MGALPKRRISKARRDRRRANDFLEAPALATCPKCGKTRRPHFVCAFCGYYGEKPKVETEKKVTKKTTKKTESK